MKITGYRLPLVTLIFFLTFVIQACGEDEKYEKVLPLEVTDGIGTVTDVWTFKYPASLAYAEQIPDELFFDTEILRTLANDSEGWGYGCYCPFKTLVQADVLDVACEDYSNFPAIMLRRMEVDCFPAWLQDVNIEQRLFELQKAATDRILAQSGFEVTDWKTEEPYNINGINVYTYTYSTLKNGQAVKHKVACLVRGEYTCELSVRSQPEQYKEWSRKFDKVLSTVELNAVEESQKEDEA